MRTCRRSAGALWLIVWLVLWSAPASAQAPLSEAQADSLVTYVEQLEFDLEICRIRGAVLADTLQIRVDLLEEQLRWAREDRRRWFHDPRIWFLIGAAAGVWVAGQAARAAF